MSVNSEKISLGQIAESHRVLRDYAQQQEHHWWKWLKLISVPLLVIVTLQNVAAQMGVGNMGTPLSWLIIAFFWVALGALRLCVVAMFQRDKKYHEERRLYYEQKQVEGFTHSAMVDGKQVMFR